MRLIDADALKSEFEWLKSVVNESSKDEIQETIQRIENAPTVDAVVLPCKVGGELFFVLNGKIYPAVVRLLLWNYRKDKGVHSEILANPNPYFSIGASFDDFGKTVFLTREEAEAALAKMGRKEDT